MSTFEVLYGNKCNIPIRWTNPVEYITLGPYMFKEMEQEVVKNRQNLKVAHD